LITVADVARAAGVSKATAARVLGGYGIVSEKTREDVVSAARALNYRPNEMARSMSTGRSGIIGVVVGDIENPFFSSAVRGIADVARSAGFNVILANSSEDIDLEKAAIRVMLGKRVDGLIVTPAQCFDAAHLRDIKTSGRPIALLDRAVPGLDVDTVTADDREAAMRMTRLLVDAGHRRIVYITAVGTPGSVYVDLDQIYTSSVRERIEGFFAVCRACGIVQPERNIRLGASRAQYTRAIVARLLDEEKPPTAIFASDSLIAYDVFKVLRERGVDIPRRLSLVTFNKADWTEVVTPSITAVEQPVYELGRRVAELLARRLSGENLPPERVVVPTRIIERQSVAPPST
jgi:LacI family transcriptional regulator